MEQEFKLLMLQAQRKMQPQIPKSRQSPDPLRSMHKRKSRLTMQQPKSFSKKGSVESQKQAQSQPQDALPTSFGFHLVRHQGKHLTGIYQGNSGL